MSQFTAMEWASALYWYCANYHTGQGSALYSILSRLPYKPGLREDGPCSFEAEEIFLLLVDKQLDPEEVLADIVSRSDVAL